MNNEETIAQANRDFMKTVAEARAKLREINGKAREEYETTVGEAMRIREDTRAKAREEIEQ